MGYAAPLRADHRYIVRMLDTVFKSDRACPTQGQVDLICEVFLRGGGSWYRLFRGSAKDVALLRKVARVAIRRGVINTEPVWG